MMLNPIIEESLSVHFRALQYRVVYAVYVGILTVAILLVWPSRGFMEFFATSTVPSAFQALALLQLLLLSGLSIYAGMDRLATAQIIRHSEWLERTRVPVATLYFGKIASSFFNTVMLLSLGVPFLFIAAGPAGIPTRSILATGLILFLVAWFCRLVGMLISIVGEHRDVIRIVGSWIFLALLYLATIQVFQPLNPVIAVIRQQNESSALVSTVDPVPFAENPVVPSAAWYLGGIAVVLLVYAVIMRKQRNRAVRKGTHA